MRTRTLSHGRRARLLTALGVLALAGAVSGLAAASSSDVSTPRLGSAASVPPDKAAALVNRMPSAATDATAGTAAAPAFAPEPIPAKILDSDVPVPVPAAVVNETNGWLVSDGYNLVAVYAGSKADDPTQGRVVIVRQDLSAGKQTVQIVDAGSTGPLTVATGAAPTGAAVETSAQSGTLTLTTSHGTRLKLDIRTGTVSGK